MGNYDTPADQQGSASGDIVGTGTNYGLFVTFNNNGTASNTDGTLGFRIRLDVAGGQNNNPSFGRVAWIGIDADLSGTVDVFLGVNFSGSSANIAIYGAGTGTNNSPSTTSIAAAAYKTFTISETPTGNYNYRPVSFATDGGTTNDVTTATTGDPDYYVSFMVPFADVTAFLATKLINITDQNPMRYVSATSTQPNSLNQDLGGVDDNTANLSNTWSQLGGFSQTVNAGGTVVVPEPSTSFLVLSALAAGLVRRRRA